MVRPKRVRQHMPEIVKAREAGETLQAIGDRYGVSREYIRQLMNEAAPTAGRRYDGREGSRAPEAIEITRELWGAEDEFGEPLLTCAEVADTLGVTRGMLGSLACRHGFRKRAPNGKWSVRDRIGRVK